MRMHHCRIKNLDPSGPTEAAALLRRIESRLRPLPALGSVDEMMPDGTILGQARIILLRILQRSL